MKFRMTLHIGNSEHHIAYSEVKCQKFHVCVLKFGSMVIDIYNIKLHYLLNPVGI